MPTYEYKCEQCGQFDFWQSIKDDALSACPTCGSPVKRLISRNVGIIFKGSGFYVTDNRSSKGGSDSGSSNGSGESAGGDSSSSSSKSSSESKPSESKSTESKTSKSAD